MENKKADVLEYSPVLPVDFDGTFRFTNWTDEDFIGKWNSLEYRFPAKTTSPILISDQTPLEIQSIRKHFAKALAEREFFKGRVYETLRLREGEKDDMGMIKPRGYGMSHAGVYTIKDLTPFIQKCLEPLQIARAEVKEGKRDDLEEKLSRDADGELNTIAVPERGDLIQERKNLRRKANL